MNVYKEDDYDYPIPISDSVTKILEGFQANTDDINKLGFEGVEEVIVNKDGSSRRITINEPRKVTLKHLIE